MCIELHTLLSQLCAHLWQSTVNYISQSLLRVSESKVKGIKELLLSVCARTSVFVGHKYSQATGQ